MSSGHPFSTDRSETQTTPMDIMEVLTLLLVIFASMTYLDIRREHHDSNKKK